MFQLIRANESDANRVADFAERIFRITFSPYHTPEDLDQYCVGAFSISQQKAELVDAARETWLALSDGAVVGYYQLISGKTDPSVKDPNPACLNRLYVDPKFHGQRLAHSLMEHVIQQAVSHGHRTLWLGVWSKNDRALGFYKKWNFVEVGDLAFFMGTDKQRDLVLERAL